MQTDVVVVGGSFAGLAAALQLARAQRPVLVVDAGRNRNRVARAAHGILGFDGFRPADILARAREQLGRYPACTLRADSAVAASGKIDAFRIELASGLTVQARRIVLALGVVDALPDLPGLAERWGSSVVHCPYCDAYELRDRHLGVLAGVAPTTFHLATLLPDWGRSTTLFTQGTLEVGPEHRARLAARGVTVEDTPVEALLGEAPALSGVRLSDGRTAPLDALFAGVPVRLGSDIAAQLGCRIETGLLGEEIETDRMKQTGVPGVFAAGDAARSGHTVTWAMSDGVTAGIGAHRSLCE